MATGFRRSGYGRDFLARNGHGGAVTACPGEAEIICSQRVFRLLNPKPTRAAEQGRAAKTRRLLPAESYDTL
jgi:hypothetical protein